MLKKHLFTFLVAACSLVARAQEKQLPSELKPFIRAGYELLDFSKADLNIDGRPDYVLIIKKAGEDTMGFDTPEWDVARPLLLVIRQANNKLKATVINNEAVLCRNCGGAMGDPYMSLESKVGEFTLDFYGGSSWKWGQTITFRYDKLKKNWFIHRDIENSSHPTEEAYVEKKTVIERSEIGDVSLQQYTQSYNQDTSSWQAIAARTYFFDSPQPGSKPRKGYLVKGNVLKSYRKFRTFIECSYANKEGEITTGFILRKDLILIPEAKSPAIQ